jgi:hypothetical protein
MLWGLDQDAGLAEAAFALQAASAALRGGSGLWALSRQSPWQLPAWPRLPNAAPSMATPISHVPADAPQSARHIFDHVRARERSPQFWQQAKPRDSEHFVEPSRVEAETPCQSF